MKHVLAGRERQAGGRSFPGAAFLFFVVLPIALIYSYLGTSDFWMSVVVIVASVVLSVGFFFLIMGVVSLRVFLSARKAGRPTFARPFHDDTGQLNDSTRQDRALIVAAILCVVLVVVGLIAVRHEWVSLPMLAAPDFMMSVMIIVGSVLLGVGVYTLLTSLVWIRLQHQARQREPNRDHYCLPAGDDEWRHNALMGRAVSEADRISAYRRSEQAVYETVVVRSVFGTAIGCVVLVVVGLVAVPHEWVSFPMFLGVLTAPLFWIFALVFVGLAGLSRLRTD